MEENFPRHLIIIIILFNAYHEFTWDPYIKFIILRVWESDTIYLGGWDIHE